MRQITIIRQKSSKHGTFGWLEMDGLSCFTGELPWKDNKPNVSCIPKGHYVLRYTYSPKYRRYMYTVEGVKGRSGIRLHSANFMGSTEDGYKCQLNGCIALGLKVGLMDGQKALLLSKPAMRQFESLMSEEDARLEIR